MDVGVQIDNYKIIEHIGRGGMADVWSARDETLGRLVAIKTIARNLNSDASPVALFEREAKTIANLEHPHILPIYGFGEYEGRLYIAMRFVTGGSLEDVLAEGALTYTDAVTVGRAIADALNHAHTENIVHLDLKPPNILLDSKGAPYLADFGLAAVLGPEGRAHNPGSGTLLYMAPEQITSEELDHRADVYSFSLVMFHMLTGRLPFEAMTPLALKQLQFGENLPHLADLNPDLPAELTDLLRRGTEVDPNERFDNVTALMAEVERVLGTAVMMPVGNVPGTEQRAGSSAFVDMVTLLNPREANLQEAKDIYGRARQAWANGSGRFLLSVTHFIVMSDFYITAEKHGLTYDQPGAQMLLRGAIEYDYHTDHWWNAVDDSGRRWVCLHAMRSETPQARIRAFQRLETLPDSDPPQIPRQVAQALSIENDEQAMLAALGVLSARAHPLDGRANGDVRTDHRDKMLDTSTPITQLTPSGAPWRNVTYSQEIDTLVADMAIGGRTETVREMAARTVGRMRSARAARHIADERKRGRRGVLKALAYVLDEVPTLPQNIEFAPRVLAWLLNTWRRLTENPMLIVWAFLFAMFGAAIGTGQSIFRAWPFPQSFFDAVRLLNMYAMGSYIGFLAGIIAIMVLTLPQRLRGFWPLWARAIWSVTAAFFLGQTLWLSYGSWYLNRGDTIPQSFLILTGLGTTFGLVLSALVKIRGWLATLITGVAMFIPLYIGATNYYQVFVANEAPRFNIPQAYATDAWVLVYNEPQQIWTILLPLVILFAIGFHFPALLVDVRDLFNALRPGTTDATVKKRADGPMTAPIDREAMMAEMPGAVATTDTQRTSAHDDAPVTERFEVGQVSAQGASQADVAQPDMTNPDMQTALRHQVPMTEEFELGQVGAAAQPADTSSDPNLQTALKPQVPMTEEFEIGQVGGATEQTDTDASDPNLQTALKPQIPLTEEFEIGQVGGTAEKADDDDPWASITKQLDDLNQEDKKDS